MTLGEWMDECGGRIWDECGDSPPLIESVIDCVEDDMGVTEALLAVEQALIDRYGDDVFDRDVDATE